MKGLSPTASRLVAVGLLLLLVAAAHAVVVRPVWQTYVAQQDAIAEQQAMLTRYRAFAADRAGLTQRLDELRSRRATGGGYLPGDSETLVAAQLQNQVKSIVESTRAKLSSSQVLQSADESGFRRIGIRVTMTADIEDLQTMLHKLESNRPYLFLDNVDISAEQQRRRSGEPPVGGIPLTVSFDVAGYMRAPG